MTARSGILLALIPLWAAVAALAWRIESGIYQAAAPEVFRGTVAPHAPAPEETADRVAEYVQLFRDGGYEPRRSDFDLPAGWKPPSDWKAPKGWNPPAWWP